MARLEVAPGTSDRSAERVEVIDVMDGVARPMARSGGMPRWSWARGAVLVAASLLLGGCSAGPVGGSAPGSPTGPPLQVEVTYSSGSVQGGVSRRPVGLGRAVRLIVRSDVSDQVHVHGYDRGVEVPANGTATVEFVADRAGVFEVELERRGVQLAQLEVR